MKKVTNNHLEPGEAMPSFFCSIASGKSSPLINREEIMRIIRFDEMTRSRTEEYRRRLSISKQEAQKVKLQMPGITISAQMNGNGKELRDVLKVLPYAALDYDNVDAELLGECVRKVKNDPFTMVEYITASGKGLRIIVAYETSQDDDLSSLEVFEASLAKATAHYNRLLGIQADKACKDVTRTCGLAHDPDAYFNWTSHAFTLSTKEMAKIYTKREMDHRQAKRRSRRPSDKGGTGKSQGAPSMEHAAPSILAMLEGQGRVFEAGSHNDYLVRFAFICLHYGINYDEVQTYVSAHFAGDYPDAAAVVKSCYKHTESLGDWHFYEEGESYAKRPSTKAVKQWLGMRYEFHQNVVTGFYELRSLDVQKGRFPRWTKIDDNIENSIWSHMDAQGFRISSQTLHAVINSDFSKAWDPFDDFLRNLPEWDGKVDYIAQLAARIRVADCPDYHHTQERFAYHFKKWIVAMVVGWVSPKVVAQQILVLIGRGGIYKTTFFNYLLPPCLREYFINDSSQNYTDKDLQEAFSSKALMCLDELEMMLGKNLSAFKSNVTKLVFSIRRPYDKYRSELLHRAALCGTSNSIQIITDPENRRFSPWLVESIESPLTHPIDYAHVYAQAVALGNMVANRRQDSADGEWVYWLTPRDIQEMKRHNGMFMVANFMADQIQRFYRVPEPGIDSQFVKFRYSSEIMERIGCSPSLSKNLAQQNLTEVMMSLGFKRLHRNMGNGWLVVEKDSRELVTDAMVSPSEVDGGL